MKKSSLLLVVAVVVMCGFLIAHNNSLKAAYLTNEYRNPLRNFVPVDIKDFDEIDLNSSFFANARIVRGDYKVMLLKSALKYIHINRVGGRLVVNSDYIESRNSLTRGYTVYISCPGIKNLNLKNEYTKEGKLVTDSVSYWPEYYRSSLTGFTFDSMNIYQDNGCALILDSNNIGKLNHYLGKTIASSSVLTLASGNKIKSLFLDTRNNSIVTLGCTVDSLRYNLDDSAEIRFSGFVYKKLHKSK